MIIAMGVNTDKDPKSCAFFINLSAEDITELLDKGHLGKKSAGSPYEFHIRFGTDESAVEILADTGKLKMPEGVEATVEKLIQRFKK